MTCFGQFTTIFETTDMLTCLGTGAVLTETERQTQSAQQTAVVDKHIANFSDSAAMLHN